MHNLCVHRVNAHLCISIQVCMYACMLSNISYLSKINRERPNLCLPGGSLKCCFFNEFISTFLVDLWWKGWFSFFRLPLHLVRIKHKIISVLIFSPHVYSLLIRSMKKSMALRSFYKFSTALTTHIGPQTTGGQTKFAMKIEGNSFSTPHFYKCIPHVAF